MRVSGWNEKPPNWTLISQQGESNGVSSSGSVALVPDEKVCPMAEEKHEFKSEELATDDDDDDIERECVTAAMSCLGGRKSRCRICRSSVGVVME